MRLCSILPAQPESPKHWIEMLRRGGFSASPAPVGPDADDATVAAYADAAHKANVVIAETGAWSNPLDPNLAKAAAALEKCIRMLDLAERLGAKCCVNIAGSCHPGIWDAPHPENFSQETFDRIVEITRKIVDVVKPKRTFYTLETMPWIFPSSPDEYLELLRAIDRPSVAVHLDPVNMINTPARAYRTGDFLRECFAKLGPLIKSCHAKDITLGNTLTVHLSECSPGTGLLDYPVYLRELSKLHPDTPLGLEHLEPEEYPAAVEVIRGVAAREGLQFV
jgi:sugar phosphate isomerase/epimerase